jgi:iron complex outermembrane recepter protein
MNSGSRTFNIYTYKNETDNYQQDHYQLFLVHEFSPNLNMNVAFHYTYGRGYYEQFRPGDDLADYGIPDIIAGGDTIANSDLVRQKWLDNDFYGSVFSLNYTTSKIKFDFGGGWNKYDGRHFGNVIWGQMLGDIEKDYEWYRNKGIKTDLNIFGKVNYLVIPGLNIFADLQYRGIEHRISGIDDDYRDITQVHTFHFFNPKAGIKVMPGANHEAYAFYGIGHREPNRSNFTDAPVEGKVPGAEELHDIETGYTFRNRSLTTGINLYYMLYNDQLVLTGEINDVGSAIMVNTDKSFRRGLELFVSWQPLRQIGWQGNISVSESKIINFTEYVDDWDNGGQVSIEYGRTDISFSPPVVFYSDLQVRAVKNLDISFISNYVGRQYIDNTSGRDRSLDPYFVSNVRASYQLNLPFVKHLRINLLVNNIFNEQYESNAWVYSYFLGQERYTMDGYFPQAGINFLGGIDIMF